MPLWRVLASYLWFAEEARSERSNLLLYDFIIIIAYVAFISVSIVVISPGQVSVSNTDYQVPAKLVPLTVQLTRTRYMVLAHSVCSSHRTVSVSPFSSWRRCYRVRDHSSGHYSYDSFMGVVCARERENNG